MATILAVFEDGVFRPKVAPALAPGTEVELTFREHEEDVVAAMKRRYPNSVGILSEGDAAELTQIIDDEFGKVNPDEWR